MVLRHGAIVLLATILLVSAWGVEVAHAIPCVTGTAASIENTSCEIGDKLFAFGSAFGFVNESDDDDAPVGDTFSNDTITFTPNAADPFAPGFTLSGAITQASTSTTVRIEAGFGIFPLEVTTLDGLSTIIGLNASVTGSTVVPPGGNASMLAVFATSTISAGPGTVAGLVPCLGSGPNCTDTAFFPSPVADTGLDGTGHLELLISVGGGATGTILSASFFVLQERSAPNQVPEPSTLILFGTSAIGLFGLARWRGRSAKI